MSDSHEAGDSLTAANPPLGRPDSRSRYEKDQARDQSTSITQLYHTGQEVYLKTRKVDHRPYTIAKVIGGGQYELLRDGKCDHKPYPEDRLQTEYPERYRVGDEVYLKGQRGIDPNAYKIHEVFGSGQYEISRDGKFEHQAVNNLSPEP